MLLYIPCSCFIAQNRNKICSCIVLYNFVVVYIVNRVRYLETECYCKNNVTHFLVRLLLTPETAPRHHEWTTYL